MTITGSNGEKVEIGGNQDVNGKLPVLSAAVSGR